MKTLIISSAIFGLAWPASGRAAQQTGLTRWCTSAIFLLSGLNTRRSGDAEQGVAAWATGLSGLVSILFITPFGSDSHLVATIITSRTCSRSNNICMSKVLWGLSLWGLSRVPTTLSSAVSLTQIAGANTTLAIGMTGLSNLISIVTMPFTLVTLVGGGIGVSIAPGQLLQSTMDATQYLKSDATPN